MFPVVSQEARAVGVDGVSLGGMVALEVGLRHPEVFGAVGAMQPAVRGREAELAARAERAAQRFPQTVRLLSSDRDPLSTRRVSFRRSCASGMWPIPWRSHREPMITPLIRARAPFSSCIFTIGPCAVSARHYARSATFSKVARALSKEYE